MDEYQEAIDLAKENLVVLQQEYAHLRQEKSGLEKKVEQIQKRQYELGGSFSSWGEIRHATNAIKTAERDARDALAREVVWGNLPPYGEGWIVDKITPKRIYIRRKNSEASPYYLRDGTSGKDYINSTIDIEKTFPEGLEEFQKANK